MTRRVNLTNRWQAVYTAGVVLPKPVARCRYFHRSLNPKKLVEVSMLYSHVDVFGRCVCLCYLSYLLPLSLIYHLANIIHTPYPI
ncbi:hypothetical protein EON63_06430 [archaeon]|nr:MAG: hypothetical protein EON63_06430 [archaeon]